MALVDVNPFVAWPNDSFHPAGYDGIGFVNDRHLGVTANWERGKIYKLIAVSSEFDVNTDSISPSYNQFGVSIYNLSDKTSYDYIDLNSTGCRPDYDKVYSFWYLPKSYEGSGSDLLCIIHQVGRGPSPSTTEAARCTIINADTGSILASGDLTDFSGAAPDPAFEEYIAVANIGDAPSVWYVIARNWNPGIYTTSSDKYSLLEISSGGITAVTTERMIAETIGAGGLSIGNRFALKPRSDGVDLFAFHGSSGFVTIDHIDFPYPFSSPALTTGVATSPINATTPGPLYHASIDGTDWLIAQSYVSIGTLGYFSAWTFSSASGSYTHQYDVSFDVSDLLDLGSVGVLSFEFLSPLVDIHPSNVPYVNGHRTGAGSVQLWVTSSIGRTCIVQLCIEAASVSFYPNPLFEKTPPETLDLVWFIASSIPDDIVICAYRRIGGTSIGDDDFIYAELASIEGGGFDEECGDGGGDEFTASLVQTSIGEFGFNDPNNNGSPGGNGTIITTAPCPIPGVVDYNRCLTGFSSVPPGTGQILCGRDDVALPCD